MAIHVIDTLKPKNNGEYKVVEAVDVGPAKDDGVNIVEGSKSIQDDIRHLKELSKLIDKIYVGTTPPKDTSKIWIDPSDEL